MKKNGSFGIFHNLVITEVHDPAEMKPSKINQIISTSPLVGDDRKLEEGRDI